MFRSLDTNGDDLVDAEELCSAVAAELPLASVNGSFVVLSIAMQSSVVVLSITMNCSFVIVSSEIKV